jgi:hypothetical protein
VRCGLLAQHPGTDQAIVFTFSITNDPLGGQVDGLTPFGSLEGLPQLRQGGDARIWRTL